MELNESHRQLLPDRLTSERRDADGDTVIESAGDYLATYTLDAVGNRTQKAVDDFDSSKDETITYSFIDSDGSLNTNDWLRGETTTLGSGSTTTYTYDLNGSMATKSVNGTLSAKYLWDLRGRMKGVSLNDDADATDPGETAYQYDHANNRVAKISTPPSGAATTTRYIVDESNPTGYAKAIEERSSTGVSPVAVKSYVLGNDILAEQDSATATVEWLLQDARGFTRLLINASGAAIAGQALDQDAFGNPLNYTLTTAGTDWTAPDGRADGETGFTYQINRYANRQTGRWISTDPTIFGAGQVLDANLQIFTGANPIYYVDPSGHESLGSLLIAAAITVMFIGNVANAPSPGGATYRDTGGRGVLTALETATLGGVISGYWGLFFKPLLEGAGVLRTTGTTVATSVTRTAVSESVQGAKAAMTNEASAQLPSIVFRFDTRLESEIFRTGFVEGANLNLADHVFKNAADSAYTSTSRSLTSAINHGVDSFGGNGFIYVIRPRSGVNVNGVFGTNHPFAREFEIAIPGGVPSTDVVGAIRLSGGELQGTVLWNRNFAQSSR